MSFSFGTPKNASGFTLSTSTVPATSANKQFSFGGGGDLTTAAKPLGLLGSSGVGGGTVSSTTTTPSFSLSSAAGPTTTSTGFTLGTPAISSAPQFSLAAGLASSATAPPVSASLFATPVTTAAPSTGFSLGSSLSLGTAPTASTGGLTFGAVTTTTSAGPTFSLGLGAIPTLATTTTASALPTSSSLTFSQLEDAINKWTVDLEEQGKLFGNQAKHLNAWDRLLISNGEKILNVSNGIERVKQQQKQLDQELDFVLAQQKELEDCIVPLEKELQDIPVSDVDRDQTYKLAENIDTQLKQMSEDLKEIIEHLNETNKAQELSDPVAQIGRILNAHMNSLQWIDRNTSQISSHLDEIARMHDLNRRNHENIHGA